RAAEVVGLDVTDLHDDPDGGLAWWSRSGAARAGVTGRCLFSLRYPSCYSPTSLIRADGWVVRARSFGRTTTGREFGIGLDCRPGRSVTLFVRQWRGQDWPPKRSARTRSGTPTRSGRSGSGTT